MDNFKITKTILENINEQNDRINECVDIVNGYTTDEETRVNQEKQRQENELRREEQYNNNENRFNEINTQLETKANLTSIFSMANMGQDIKEAMTGGSVAVVGINSVADSNVIEESLGVEGLNGDFTQKTYNEIKIKGIKYNADDLEVSSIGDYISINGTTTTGGNIKIYFDNPTLKSGNYYIKLDNILCTDTLEYKGAYADGSFSTPS